MACYGGSAHTLQARVSNPLPAYPTTARGTLSGAVLSAASQLVSLKIYFPPSPMYSNRCRLRKANRNQHALAYVRREVASKYDHLQSDIRYCYQCFGCVVGSKEWGDCCQRHTNTLPLQAGWANHQLSHPGAWTVLFFVSGTVRYIGRATP